MIGLGVIGATVFFLPGILFILLGKLWTTPALQNRESEGSSSVFAIGVITFVSLISHLLALSILFGLGRIGHSVGIGNIDWTFRLFDQHKNEMIKFEDVYFTLLYIFFACGLAALFAWRSIPKNDLTQDDLTLSTLCRQQEGDDNLLLVGYVYFKAPRGTQDTPISGLVGGVSYLRLDTRNAIQSITLIEPIPFVQFIDEDTLQADILEYGDPTHYQQNAASQTAAPTLAEITSSEISHIVYAIHDKTKAARTLKAQTA